MTVIEFRIVHDNQVLNFTQTILCHPANDINKTWIGDGPSSVPPIDLGSSITSLNLPALRFILVGFHFFHELILLLP